MNKNAFFIVMLAAFVFYKVFIASDESTTDNAKSKPNSASDLHGPEGNYSLRSGDDSWPALDENKAGEVADNLLAKNYYIVFDGSGSMGEVAADNCSDNQRKIDVAKSAMQTFIKQLPADANVGLYVFDGNAMSERVGVSANSRTQLKKAIKETYPGGGTPLSLAVQQAYNSLLHQAKKQLGYGEYHLIVITDGEANSGYGPGTIVNSVIKYSPVNIHTIGFCISDRHSLNQKGRTFYKSATSRRELEEGLSSVLAESEEFVIDEFSEG